MDIVVLKTFLEVAKTRHFGQAANNLCVTQSTVSARINLLEKNLGVNLFTRGRNNIHLTPKGEIFLRHAQTMTSSWEIAQKDMFLEEVPIPTFRLGCNIDMWHIIVAKRIQQIDRSTLNLELHHLNDIPTLVQHDKLDAGFVFDSPALPGIVTTKVGAVTFTLVSTHPDICFEDALGDGYIMVNWGAGFFNRYHNLIGSKGLSTLTVSHGSIAQDMLHRYGGSAFLPEPLWQADDHVHPVAQAPKIRRDIMLVYAKNTMHSGIIEGLMEDV
jgi:LysR family transcriptional regulator, flagellar master operon regulator